ncbi:hypothetical protein Pint_19455 [Pistacia integerrima]|uniref:Uncharacterized protein n=1 Tax=Pistacia integerrima TaxID=434235 RepID=A0ACC0YW79_9ROSI|nr:hypothetical protein Pint_19455 [Pistacia integerrima]
MLKGEAGEKDEQVEEVTCKMIVGRGVGKVLEKIKSESGGGTQVKVLAKDQIPGSGSGYDELIHACVRRKVLSEFYELTEGGCLDGFKITGSFPTVRKALSSISSCGQDSPREDAANREGGSIVRTFQNETGASIKIGDVVPNSDEWVVLISAREIGFEPGNAIVAQLLVHSQLIGCLLGRGGYMISEMRDTGASIRVFPREQAPKCGSPNDEVVQCL